MLKTKITKTSSKILVFLASLAVLSVPVVRAGDLGSSVVENPTATVKTVPLNRGEATNMVVNYFDLEKKNSKFLNYCQLSPEECLFSFTTRTNFDEINYKPIILYPDVYPAYRYYKAINIASELDLVRGYYEEENSPYRPEKSISKIEALKLVLGASGLLKWEDKFELNLNKTADSEQKNWLAEAGEQWWYARYITSAMSKGILTGIGMFDPNATISREELQGIMDSTQKILANGQNGMSLVDKYGQVDKEANTSRNSAI